MVSFQYASSAWLLPPHSLRAYRAEGSKASSIEGFRISACFLLFLRSFCSSVGLWSSSSGISSSSPSRGELSLPAFGAKLVLDQAEAGMISSPRAGLSSMTALCGRRPLSVKYCAAWSCIARPKQSCCVWRLVPVSTVRPWSMGEADDSDQQWLVFHNSLISSTYL